MGQGTAVIRRSRTPRSETPSEQKSLRLKIDVPLLLITCTLVVLGILMVLSASWDISYRYSDSNSPSQMFTRQIMWLSLGLVGMTILTWVNYHLLERFAVIGMLVTIGALLLVLLIGEDADGTQRTLFGNSIQPSELAKLIVIIYLAVWLFAKRDFLSNVGFGLVPLAAILGIVGGLIFSQPDLSAAVTILILGGIMFFLAGGDTKQILFLLVAAVLIGLIIVLFTPTGSIRFDEFWSGFRNPLESSDHVQDSLAALAQGGWFGVGIGKGIVKLVLLPVPHTDSIFAVIGEEFGVLGTTVVVILFGLLLWRGLLIAKNAPDGLGQLLAAGITIWITMEAFMNMMALTGLMPFAGNALPFFSLGGSSLVFTLLGIGIVLNISRLSEQKQEEELRSTISAFIDLRRRDWRRRVSRARDPRKSRR
jgi:cell division protein FtsW